MGAGTTHRRKKKDKRGDLEAMNKRRLLFYIPMGMLVALNPICILSYLSIESKIQSSINFKLIFEISGISIVTIFFTFIFFFLFTISHPKFETRLNAWLERGEY